MDNARIERRTHMLEKVRKLLAMGRDGRGNENEQETAMRQANKLMAEYGIAEAECDMNALVAGEMIFGEAQCGPDGRAPEQGKVYRTMPSWCGILCIGVARFTDSVVVRKRTANGEMLAFRGEQQDVLLARWIFGVLGADIQREQCASGWTTRGEASSFKVAAASTLASRLKALWQERQQAFEQARAMSNSRALVVVDSKRQEIVARFGAQKVSHGRSGYSSSGAATAGHEAGQRINIPAGRPVGQSTQARLR